MVANTEYKLFLTVLWRFFSRNKSMSCNFHKNLKLLIFLQFLKYVLSGTELATHLFTQDMSTWVVTDNYTQNIWSFRMNKHAAFVKRVKNCTNSGVFQPFYLLFFQISAMFERQIWPYVFKWLSWTNRID